MKEHTSGLNICAYFGLHQVAEKILNVMSMHKQNHYGHTPLHHAAQYGYSKTTALFLDSRNVDVDARDVSNCTH
jgi:ankyrin repeat protein